jgi:hypothetical protein
MKPQTRKRDVFKTSAVNKKCSEKETQAIKVLNSGCIPYTAAPKGEDAAINCKLPL